MLQKIDYFLRQNKVFFAAKKQKFFGINEIFFCGKEKKPCYPFLPQKNISFGPKNYYFFAAKKSRYFKNLLFSKQSDFFIIV